MKEIEILVQVYAPEADVLHKLDSFEFIGNKRTIDTYFYDPQRKDLHPDDNGRLFACFRLRQKDGISYITYKKDHFDGDKWLYSDEYETTVESADKTAEIIKKLGFLELVKIDNIKRTYKYQNYTIEFEKVENLGLFLEVELCTEETVDVKDIKNQIQRFIDDLGFTVSAELNAGKPEMMLRKQNNI